MKELQKSDLQPGDILIFENQDFSFQEFYSLTPSIWNWNDKEKWMPAAFYLLVYMIPWFDPGDDPVNYKNIYHAAIWGNVNINRGEKAAPEFDDRIVQAGPDGIVQDDLESTVTGHGVKNIYVCRHKSANAKMYQKINEATRSFYNDTSIPYSYETAWLLAVICSMRYSDGALYRILQEKLGTKLATIMVGVIQELINQYNDDHQREMVACSTLVAMIYKDAGFALDFTPLEKDQPVAVPADLTFDPLKLRLEERAPEVPQVSIKETVVTPRQLAESPDVEAVGFFPYRGK